jgi:hypothetical protein
MIYGPSCPTRATRRAGRLITGLDECSHAAVRLCDVCHGGAERRIFCLRQPHRCFAYLLADYLIWASGLIVIDPTSASYDASFAR